NTSMCIGGEALPSSLSVPRTLRSVLTGSLEPLRGIRVCYMYYTDVFVGTNKDIVKLKSALKAELPSFNSNELNQLVHGLCLFMGYPSCLCKPKKSVKESLKKISGELKEELKNYKCLSKPSLNCDSCSTSVVCKCCVLDCILKVQKCRCVQDSSKNCSCSNDDGTKRCCKDLLEKLKASLSLLNLKADMEICKCPENCCDKGECTKGSSNCSVCKTLQASKDYTVTGLGLLRPSPIRLAGKLEKFFGDKASKGSSGCTCKCNGSTPDKSCCCLACDSGKCFESCTAKCGSQGCSSQHTPQGCPCKTFCSKIDNIKIAADSDVMKCCESGAKCHCQVDSTCTASSGQKCCDTKKKVKCMIRRLVSYFNGLKFDTSSDKFFKSCCELLCVKKTCEFLWKFYGKRTATVCSECKKGTQGKFCKGSSCCNGTITKCIDPKCCKDCEVCNAVKFSRALEELRFAGPCGQDLYRVLDDIFHCCGALHGILKDYEERIKKEQEKCSQCCKPGQSSPCDCCKPGPSPCPACTSLLQDSKLMSILRHGYSSAYSEASWASLTSSTSGSKCCSLPSCPKCQTCSSPSSCDPKDCCEKCPKRLCAKIFLGMVPCLYYGLKFLKERCKGEWKDLLISNQDYSPGRFLVGMGFDLGKLDENKKGSEIFTLLSSLINDSDGPLQSLYDVSKNYFTSRFTSLVPSSDSDSQPKTVRDILLWLSGLPFTSGFHDLVSRCKDLCSPFGNSFHPDAFCYYIYTCCFLLPASFISVIETSESAQKVFTSAEWKTFSYPSDPSELFETFCDFVRKIFVALQFLCIQCRLPGPQAGWKYCYFGKDCKVEPLDSGSASGSSGSLSTSGSSSSSGCTSCKYSGAYLCTGKPYGTDDAHDHCAKKAGQTCVGFGSSVSKGCSGSNHQSGSKTCPTPCPHPLMRFLVDGSSDSKSNSLFQPPEGFPPMGFLKENFPSPGKKGFNLYNDIKVFCESGFYPLTRLLQFSLCIFRNPPDTLGELFGFFM
ncbi:hypothetical protein X943_001153, partial [Babesia divergens]